MADRDYMKNIVELNFSNYKFELYYAEILDEKLPEFPHSHNMYEIYYPLKDRIRMEIGSEHYTVHEGEVVFIDKNVHHYVYTDPECEKRYFAMIFDIYPRDPLAFSGPDGADEWKDIKNAMYSFEKSGSYIKRLEPTSIPEQLIKEVHDKKLGWNSRAVMLAYTFFIDALRQISDRPVTDLEFAGYSNLAMDVSKYIHSHYSEDISVESAAAFLNVSERHINRAYKSTFNITFMKNVNLLRIAYAKWYLFNTDDSVESIAEKVGFQSARVFYRLFQQYEGISATQYRERSRKNAELH